MSRVCAVRYWLWFVRMQESRWQMQQQLLRWPDRLCSSDSVCVNSCRAELQHRRLPWLLGIDKRCPEKSHELASFRDIAEFFRQIEQADLVFYDLVIETGHEVLL